MTSADLIETPRLMLRLIPAAELITLFREPNNPALWANKPFSNPHRVLIDDPGPLPWRVPQVEQDPSLNNWFVRWIINKQSSTIIGSISFHGAPDAEGMIEIGLGIEAEHRNRGYAKEALLGMWTWVVDQPGVKTLRYTVSPTNEPSIAIIRHFGFDHVGQQIDEIDGPEDIYEMSAETFRTRWIHHGLTG